jgi:hypothetical protein
VTKSLNAISGVLEEIFREKQPEIKKSIPLKRSFDEKSN